MNSSNKKVLFDNEKAEEILKRYVDSRDPIVLGELLSECRALISVIASNYATSEDHKEDLEQEARLQLIKVLREFDSSKNTKLYSWLSVVARNAMIDCIRREKPEFELPDTVEMQDSQSESEFLVTVVENMLSWFTMRFPTLLNGSHNPFEILESILCDLIDEKVGKRKLVGNLRDSYGFTQAEATILYEAVMVRLRMMMGVEGRRNYLIDEKSLEPELEEVLGGEMYLETKAMFKGLSVRFRNVD